MSSKENSRKPFRLLWSTKAQNTIHATSSILKETSSMQGPLVDDSYLTFLQKGPFPGCFISAVKSSMTDMSKFEVFDFNKGFGKVFSSGDKPGYITDIACNKKTNRAALLSVRSRIAYHIYDCSNWNSPPIQAKWPEVHRNHYLSSLDFDPEGSKVVTVDDTGMSVVTNINTDSTLFNLNLGGGSDGWNKARWSPLGNSIAISFDSNKLNLIDPNAQQLVFSKAISTESNLISSFDWRNDGQLIALCADNGTVDVVDTRIAKTSKRFINLHEDFIASIQWSLAGDMLATASYDKRVKVIEFKTGKVIHTTELASGQPGAVCFLEIN